MRRCRAEAVPARRTVAVLLAAVEAGELRELPRVAPCEPALPGILVRLEEVDGSLGAVALVTGAGLRSDAEDTRLLLLEASASLEGRGWREQATLLVLGNITASTLSRTAESSRIIRTCVIVPPSFRSTTSRAQITVLHSVLRSAARQSSTRGVVTPGSIVRRTLTWWP